MPLLNQLNLCFPGHFPLKAVCDHIYTLMAPLDDCDVMYFMLSSHFARDSTARQDTKQSVQPQYI